MSRTHHPRPRRRPDYPPARKPTAQELRLADSIIGAAQALEVAAARLKERAGWIRHPPSTQVIEHADWARYDIDRGHRTALDELKEHLPCDADATLLPR